MISRGISWREILGHGRGNEESGFRTWRLLQILMVSPLISIGFFIGEFLKEDIMELLKDLV